MRQHAARLLALASSRAPWLFPAIGIALFVHKHFICYQSQGTAAASAKARTRSRPPKLRRAVKKAQAQTDATLLDVNFATSAEQEHLDAMGLSSDKLMEWFTEDEVEALQQAQANPAAFYHLMSGSRFQLDEQYDEPDDGWYTDHTYDSLDNDSYDPEYDTYLDTLDNNANSSANDSAQGGFEIQPLSGLTAALSNSDDTAASSPPAPGQQQQQWYAAQQLLQQLSDMVQQEQQQPQQTSPAADADMHSNADSADYFNPQQYYALSPAANRRSRASLDMLQGNYLPRSGALWASSYPPHMDDLETDEAVNEYLDRDYQRDDGCLGGDNLGAVQGCHHRVTAMAEPAVCGNQVGAGNREAAAAAAADSSNSAPQQQQYSRLPARWLAEFEPPMPDFDPPDFDFNPDYDFDYDYDYEPDYVPGFDDALGFDQLEAAFASTAAAAAPS